MKKYFKFNIKQIQAFTFALVIAGSFITTSCKKFLDIPSPSDKIGGDAAFANDKAAAAVLNSVYSNFFSKAIFDSGSGLNNATSLYTDELTLVSAQTAYLPFYANQLPTETGGAYWISFYKLMQTVNLTIEAMRSSSIPNKSQWLGEALFLRAFIHFYLVNLYGDVPIVISSDYNINKVLTRSPKADVYKQIIADALEAQGLLTADYRGNAALTSTDRGRPNKSTATALLARAYLYTGDWTNAEAQATLVINNTTIYQLTAPSQTFLANSKETIWAIAPVSTDQMPYVRDYQLYNNNAPAAGTGNINTSVVAVMRPSLVTLFENGDTRFTNWTRSVTTTFSPGTVYTLINKYKSNVNGVEYVMLFRFAEMYLIRAEARAQLNNISGAQSDINAIRSRAGLGATTAATPADLLTAISKERQLEFFTEAGHRFFDLRRTGKIDPVMTLVSPQKNSAWSSYNQYWPISVNEILNDPNLKQTTGY